MMNVKIFTEGGPDIGLGHISRCTSLYDEVASRGFNVELVIYGDENNIGLLKKRNFTFVNWYDKNNLYKCISKSDYVIVDSYKANLEIYEIISQISKRALYIDDVGRLNYPKGIVLNPALDTSYIVYPKDKAITYLLGPHYIILRPPFIDVKRDYIEKNIQNALIVMGGTDIRNLLPDITTQICTKYPDINFRIIIGTTSNELEEISNNGVYNVKIYNNLTGDEIKQLMLESDFAITAAGQTIYELIATCTPFIPIQVIDNQKFTVSAILENNLVHKVLNWESDSLREQIIQEIELLKEQAYRVSLSDKYSNFIDGKGVQRIIDELMG
ncbi:Spore coat polysaccharide biosynthesis protein, predicted glycosyltransferase [Aerococcus viridans]|uniref:UDP-2,4-diacetamido-2,4, 6-trideoxy-beta-L-altropyranose hydrolase n=3 Tax=Aerococcus viridans TaxID=1377 RepID=A0AAU8U9K1_9LACT|nr:hypothetical protein [Aerococcus viridans]AMC01345.1 hypothetical protein AWM76_07160 [Aerococcus viridans]EFG50211.1 glycosyltransferase family 28 C-terminal domain protein [Aerococcus viridans ATCC 11563 = CCUG 4311]SUU15936.1 Spore coat polysaccharide biosynthesis protein, predicted glycosyltransferase [Aerococcus viridans]